MGPPSEPLTSQTRLTSLVARRPCFLRVSVRLPLWNPSFAPLRKNIPEKRLPPSLGIMLMRIPPVPVSAEIAPVSKLI
jgi:hypothetical protein